MIEGVFGVVPVLYSCLDRARTSHDAGWLLVMPLARAGRASLGQTYTAAELGEKFLVNYGWIDCSACVGTSSTTRLPRYFRCSAKASLSITTTLLRNSVP